jgi:hypothetical protein
VKVLGFDFDWGNDEGGIGGISQGKCRMFWHLREFRVADLDGNQLRVFYDSSSELRPAASDC